MIIATINSMDLFELAKINNFELIEKLVKDNDCNVDDKDDFGRTALHICSTFGCVESCQKLISLGADLTIQDFESGWTALHRALYHGHLKVSLLLIKAGADLGDNWRTDDWTTIVHLKKEAYRSMKNFKTWRSPIDHGITLSFELFLYSHFDFLI